MWTKVESVNPSRCEICGGFALAVWKYFKTPTTSSHCVCDGCAQAALEAS